MRRVGAPRQNLRRHVRNARFDRAQLGGCPVLVVFALQQEDRLDDPLVELFRQRGVPEQQILYLKDSKATTAEVEDRVPAFLAQSKPEEILIFYYSSHGGYDPKTGAHTYTTFDGSIPIGWFGPIVVGVQT